MDSDLDRTEWTDLWVKIGGMTLLDKNPNGGITNLYSNISNTNGIFEAKKRYDYLAGIAVKPTVSYYANLFENNKKARKEEANEYEPVDLSGAEVLCSFKVPIEYIRSRGGLKFVQLKGSKLDTTFYAILNNKLLIIASESSDSYRYMEFLFARDYLISLLETHYEVETVAPCYMDETLTLHRGPLEANRNKTEGVMQFRKDETIDGALWKFLDGVEDDLVDFYSAMSKLNKIVKVEHNLSNFRFELRRGIEDFLTYKSYRFYKKHKISRTLRTNIVNAYFEIGKYNEGLQGINKYKEETYEKTHTDSWILSQFDWNKWIKIPYIDIENLMSMIKHASDLLDNSSIILYTVLSTLLGGISGALVAFFVRVL